MLKINAVLLSLALLSCGLCANSVQKSYDQLRSAIKTENIELTERLLTTLNLTPEQEIEFLQSLTEEEQIKLLNMVITIKQKFDAENDAQEGGEQES